MQERWLVLAGIRVSFFSPKELQVDMLYVRCLAERNYVARLSTLVVSLKDVGGFSHQNAVYYAVK